jgi:hypothetical protein
VRPNIKAPGYFRLKADLSNQVEVRTRLEILAASLWNLSEPLIPGFMEALDRWNIQMDEGDANEVNLAAHLKRWGVPFTFHPRKQDEKSYDFDVKALNGEIIAVEGKCRSVKSKIDWQVLTRKLRKAARDQLPKGHPGALFVQLENEWLPDGWHLGKTPEMEAAIGELFKNYSRVVLIVFFTFTTVQVEESQHWYIWYREARSAVHGFDKTKDWAILGHGRKMPPGWSSLTNLVESYLA